MIGISARKRGLWRPEPGRGVCTLLLVLAMLLGFSWADGSELPRAEANGVSQQSEAFPQIIPSDQFVALAAEKLEERLVSIGETRRHELKLIRAPQSMRLPEGEVSCEVQLPKILNYGMTNPVNMLVYVNGKLFRRTVCYYNIRVYEQVLLVTHDLGLEHRFTAADVRVEEREVEAASVEYFHSPQEVIGKVPSRVLKAGQVLRLNMVQMPVAVEVGAPVDILVDVNGVQVKAEGIAMQKGRIGTYIRVKNARSGKYLRGKVIDAHTVQIE